MNTCSLDWCERPNARYRTGYCAAHQRRYERGTDLARPVGPLTGEAHPNWSGGYVDPDGYRKISGVREHRLVMVGVLGRELLDGETVHHKNGDRLDNRPENLELWVVHQPRGQRVEDLVAWAKEILRRYGHQYS